MKKIANSILFSDSERRILKSLIDRKYGKSTSSVDYESTGGLHDRGIEGDIFLKTGEVISGSTLERLVGLTREKRKANTQTLEKVAKYLDFSSAKGLLDFMERHAGTGRNTDKKFEISDLLRKNHLRLKIGEGKAIVISHLAENVFELVESSKSILRKRDRIYLGELELGRELRILEVKRPENGKLVSMGSYTSGSNNHISEIAVIRPIDPKNEQNELFS